MSITRKQLKDLIGVTLQDLPRSSIEDMINCITSDLTPGEIACIVKFIKNNYSVKEIQNAITERIKVYERIFGD